MQGQKLAVVLGSLARRPSPWAAWAVCLWPGDAGELRALCVPRDELHEQLRKASKGQSDRLANELAARPDHVAVLELGNDRETLILELFTEAQLRQRGTIVQLPAGTFARIPKGKQQWN
jgi:hypothetical protein